MNVAELIDKLQRVDQRLLVCTEDGETGLQTDGDVWELTARVDRDHNGEPHYADEHIARGIVGTETNERVIVITHWGHEGTGTYAARQL